MDASTDGKALFFSDPRDIMTKMQTHQKLAFEFTPFNASPAETTFTITGYVSAVTPLAKAYAG
jgi:hypothetical protein